jgi:hypothetical protein
MSPTPLGGPKTSVILQAGFVLSTFAINQCAAAEA